MIRAHRGKPCLYFARRLKIKMDKIVATNAQFSTVICRDLVNYFHVNLRQISFGPAANIQKRSVAVRPKLSVMLLTTAER